MNKTEPGPCTLKNVAELALKEWSCNTFRRHLQRNFHAKHFSAGSRSAYARILTKITNEHTLAGWIRVVEAME